MRSGGRPDDVDNRLMLNCYFIDSACSTDSAGTTSPIVPSMAAGNGKNLTLFCRGGAKMRFAEISFAVF